MKKKILSILPLLLFTATLVNAQFVEPTTYRGAFAPAPTAQWTDNWINWDPQNTFYGAPTVTIPQGSITASTTWTKNNVYLIQGLVFVDSLVTLTIEPGTVIRGDANTIISSLIISRGATIIANGTPCNPIVFTSSRAAGARVRGDWGGLTILGRGVSNLGTNVSIEGITAGTQGRYGGTNNADNSGILRYVRIEYAGFAIATDNELNSLTFGGVGSGTTVDYVQTSFGNDDAFEWFGGAVNCKHLVSYRTLDDDFDTDNGYSGTVQFALAVKDPNVADNVTNSTSEGFESDNNGTSPFTILPKTSASFYNVTQIGAFRCTSNSPSVTQPSALGFRRGARIRRNSELKIFNSILMNNWRGLTMDADVIANSATGGAAFKNNVVAMDYTFNSSVSGATGLALAAENAATSTYLTAVANTNSIVSTPCDVLVNAWSFLNPDYRPNLTAGSTGATLSGCDLAPGIQIETSLFNPSTVATAQECVVDLFESAIGNSNGTITVTIAVPPSFTGAVNGITTLPTTLATAVGGNAGTSTNLGAPYDNTVANWKFYRVGAGPLGQGGTIIAVSQPGFSVPVGGQVSLGLTVRRNTGVPAGTNQSLNVTVSGGGDTNSSNDGTLTGVGTTN